MYASIQSIKYPKLLLEVLAEPIICRERFNVYKMKTASAEPLKKPVIHDGEEIEATQHVAIDKFGNLLLFDIDTNKVFANLGPCEFTYDS